MELYLIRHTTPENKGKVCYGRSDIPIDQARFEEEFLEIKNQFIHIHQVSLTNALIYSSPSSRCLELAEKIQNEFCIRQSIHVDDRLMELDFGDWEMRPWDQISKEEIDEWLEDFVNGCPPGGESLMDLSRRAELFLNSLSAYSDTSLPIIIVTHAGFIRALLCFFHKYQLSDFFNISVNYGSVTRIPE